MAKEYYSIVTKKFTLRTNHAGWLAATRNLYNEILGFYYELFLEHEEIQELNSQNALRALEQLTIVGRDKMPVPEPLPWKKVPLYFRRAAINEAIASGKSYLSREVQDEPTKKFNTGITFYKGMYSDLKSDSVSLKVYNGEKWQWLRCRLSGNQLSDDEECMSPKLVFRDRQLQLHVPVRMHVDDGRKLKERISKDLKICSLQFTNNDAFVVGCVMGMDEEIKRTLFIRGGLEYQYRCQKILENIEISNRSVGGKAVKGANKKYWLKLQKISEDMAHQASRKIIDTCKKNEVSIIVVPQYSKDFSKYVMSTTGKWSPLRLGRRILEKLNYKAWQAGILVVEVEVAGINSYCAICGNKIQNKNEIFECTSGHQGNRRLNSARNLGKKFINNMKKDMP